MSAEPRVNPEHYQICPQNQATEKCVRVSILQLDLVKGCPAIWSNITLGDSVRVFEVSLVFTLIDQIEQIALPNVSFIQSMERIE